MIIDAIFDLRMSSWTVCNRDLVTFIRQLSSWNTVPVKKKKANTIYSLCIFLKQTYRVAILTFYFFFFWYGLQFHFFIAIPCLTLVNRLLGTCNTIQSHVNRINFHGEYNVLFSIFIRIQRVRISFPEYARKFTL